VIFRPLSLRCFTSFTEGGTSSFSYCLSSSENSSTGSSSFSSSLRGICGSFWSWVSFGKSDSLFFL
jgi:hypothetical protein